MVETMSAKGFLCGLLTDLSKRKLVSTAQVDGSQLPELCNGLLSRSRQQDPPDTTDLVMMGRGLWELVHSPHYAGYVPKTRNTQDDRQFIEGLTDGYGRIEATQESPAYLQGNALGKEVKGR